MSNEKEPDTNAGPTLKELLLSDGPQFDLELSPRRYSKRWSSFFRTKQVSNDFMNDREQPEGQEREPF